MEAFFEFAEKRWWTIVITVTIGTLWALGGIEEKEQNELGAIRKFSSPKDAREFHEREIERLKEIEKMQLSEDVLLDRFTEIVTKLDKLESKLTTLERGEK